ncbi:MAG: hypothetical protein WAV38_21090 [Xanthobacteraceae bacterium]
MRNRVILASVVALAIGLFSFNLAAQVIPRSIQEGGTDAALREKKNAWTVGIAGGLLSGTYMRFVDEMASVLNDGDNLRILPIVSYGSAPISTISCTFAASTRRLPNPTCSNISAPSAKRPILSTAFST